MLANSYPVTVSGVGNFSRKIRTDIKTKQATCPALRKMEIRMLKRPPKVLRKVLRT